MQQKLLQKHSSLFNRIYSVSILEGSAKSSISQRVLVKRSEGRDSDPGREHVRAAALSAHVAQISSGMLARPQHVCFHTAGWVFMAGRWSLPS